MDGGIRLWDYKTLECKVSLVGHQQTVSAISENPENSDMILTCGYDQKICYWDISGVDDL